MKSLFPSAVFALALAGGFSLSAAETRTALAAGKSTVGVSVSGEYAGKWKGKDEAGGELRIKLRQDGNATWVAEAVFTFQGNEVPTKTKSVAVDGSKLELTIGWEIDGTAAQTKLTGALSGNVLEGTFDSSTSESSASGTWRVTRA